MQFCDINSLKLTNNSLMYTCCGVKIFILLKWREAELNRRHEDFQSSALPTELSCQENLFLTLDKHNKIINLWQELKLI